MGGTRPVLPVLLRRTWRTAAAHIRAMFSEAERAVHLEAGRCISAARTCCPVSTRRRSHFDTEALVTLLVRSAAGATVLQRCSRLCRGR
jgi:hypothetical protein